MSKIDRTISKTLGIENDVVIDHMPSIDAYRNEVVISEATNLPAIPDKERPALDTSKDIAEDYELSRQTFHSLIEVGSKAISDVADLAKDSESAKAYEVLAKLIETVSGATKDLYDLQKKTKELSLSNAGVDGKKPVDETNITVEKAVFVGTTADLLREMKAEQEKKK